MIYIYIYIYIYKLQVIVEVTLELHKILKLKEIILNMQSNK